MLNANQWTLKLTVSEDDCKDNAAKVTASACEPGHDSVCVRVYVRHKGEVESVGTLQEKKPCQL